MEMNTLTLEHIEYVCGINYAKVNEFIEFHDDLFYHYIIGSHQLRMLGFSVEIKAKFGAQFYFS